MPSIRKKWPINREVDLHKSVWWYRNYDHIFQIFSRYPNSFRTRFHYQHQKVAVSTANVSCFIGEKSLICICLMSLGSKQTNNMHRIEAYHICDWNGIEWFFFLFPKTRLKRGYLKYNSHPKKRPLESVSQSKSLEEKAHRPPLSFPYQ